MQLYINVMILQCIANLILSIHRTYQISNSQCSYFERIHLKVWFDLFATGIMSESMRFTLNGQRIFTRFECCCIGNDDLDLEYDVWIRRKNLKLDGEEADFPTVLAEASWDEPPAPSRLGPRWPAQTVKKKKTSAKMWADCLPTLK